MVPTTNSHMQARSRSFSRLCKVVGAVALALSFLTTAAPASAAPICDLVEYQQMNGAETVYRGTAFGRIWLIGHDGRGNVEFKVLMNISPGALFTLKPDQAWSCAAQ